MTDEQLRRFTSAAFSRPGYQVPSQLLSEIRAMPYRSIMSTTQASRDYVKEQALPSRLAALGKPLLVIFGEEDPKATTACLAADWKG